MWFLLCNQNAQILSILPFTKTMKLIYLHKWQTWTATQLTLQYYWNFCVVPFFLLTENCYIWNRAYFKFITYVHWLCCKERSEKRRFIFTQGEKMMKLLMKESYIVGCLQHSIPTLRSFIRPSNCTINCLLESWSAPRWLSSSSFLCLRARSSATSAGFSSPDPPGPIPADSSSCCLLQVQKEQQNLSAVKLLLIYNN